MRNIILIMSLFASVSTYAQQAIIKNQNEVTQDGSFKISGIGTAANYTATSFITSPLYFAYTSADSKYVLGSAAGVRSWVLGTTNGGADLTFLRYNSSGVYQSFEFLLKQSTGNLLIKTTVDDGNPLQVNGNISAATVKFPSFPRGSIPFANFNGTLVQSSSMFGYDTATSRLYAPRLKIIDSFSVGSSLSYPMANFHVAGSMRFDIGSDATGDMFYRNSSGVLGRIPAGSNGQILSWSSGGPTWSAVSAGSVVPLKDFYTDQGNTSTSANVYTSLFSYDIPANTITATGQKVTAEYAGSYAANANGKGLQIFVAGTGVATITSPNNGGKWQVRVVLLRTGSSTARVSVVSEDTGLVYRYNMTGLDYTSAITLAIWGTSAAGVVSDVVGEMGFINWAAAAP